jgi:hypothetical protein
MSFPTQFQRCLDDLCQIYSKCIQRYALQCSDDGHLTQLIFGADLCRAYCSRHRSNGSSALMDLLNRQLVTFEEQHGTHVKSVAFFLKNMLSETQFARLSIHERRCYLTRIVEKMKALSNPLRHQPAINIDQLDYGSFVDLILDTLPRDIFDRRGTYRELLVRLVEGRRVRTLVSHYVHGSF